MLRGALTLFAARLLRSRLEVELSIALLIEHAIASGTAATHVHPIGWHDDNRPWTEIFGRRCISPDIPDPADYHVLDLAAVRVKRVIRSRCDLTYLRVRPNFWIAG